jgi:hypothetical protein
MISTFVSLAVPVQAVTSMVIGALLILLIAAQLMDFEGSRVRSFIIYLQTFTVPLLVLFVLIVIFRIIAIIA